MTEERIAYVVSVQGAEPAAGSFDKVAKSMNGAASAGGSFNAKVSGASMVVADFGMALGRNSPAIAQFTNVVTGARSSLMGLTAALGGPMGLAAGAAAAGVIAGVEFFTRAQNEAAEATRIATEAINRQQVALSALNQDLARAAGIAGPSDSEALRARIAKSGATGSERQRLELLASMAEDREYAAANAAELAKVNAAEASLGRGRRGGGGSAKGNADFMGARGRADASGVTDADMDAFLAGGSGDIDKFMAEQAKAGDFEIENTARIEERKFEIWAESRQRQLDAIEDVKEADAKAGQERLKMLTTTGAAGAAALGQQLAAVSRGQKMNMRAILATLGEAAVGEGTMGVLRAALMATNPLTVGFAPAHLAASLAMIGGGMALGAASAGGGGGGKSAGGGVAISRPVPSANGGEGGGGGPTYINISMPSVVKSDPEVGREIARHVQAAQRVYGNR